MQTVPVTPSHEGVPAARASRRPYRRRREQPPPHLVLAELSPVLTDRERTGFDVGCPPLRAEFIRRPRLVKRLREDREASVVLLAAPPGYGKTTTLSEWAERDERPFAWVTLCEGDNDCERLLATLTLAIEQLTVIDRGLSRGAAVEGHGASTLTDLIEALSATRAGAVLVLDDLQLVRSPASLAVLARLASAMPSGTKLALASRTEPVLSLARLRTQHQLLALGASDLAMSIEEADALLNAAGVALAPDELELALRRTEGWPAALYLVATALGEEPDAAAALERFSGEEELVSRYIREELLAPMPADAQALLVGAAILDELSPELCDVVLDRTDSGLVLRDAAASNLLVAPLDRGHRRFRCHPLLREVLQAELSRSDSTRAARLHMAAARWFAERGELERAGRHAGAAGDLDYMGRLLWAQAPRVLSEKRRVGLRSSLDRLSHEQIASVPSLALAAAYCALLDGDLRRATHWSQFAGRTEPDTDALPGYAAGLAVLEAAVGQEGLERMSATAARGYRMADDGSPWRSACCLLSGVSACLSGQRTHARAMLSEGASRGAVACPGIESHCLSQLAVIAAEDHDWETAGDLIERAGVALARAGLGAHPTSALVLAASAWVCSHQGRADEAKRDLARSLQMLAMLEGYIPWYEVQTRVLAARTAVRLADVPLARTQLSQASRLARRTPEIVVFRAWFDEAWGKVDGLSAAALGGSSSLTMAELRILRFLPTHLSFREIGTRLHVSTNTVKSQVHAVYRKLDAASRSEAVEHASTLGLIDVCI